MLINEFQRQIVTLSWWREAVPSVCTKPSLSCVVLRRPPHQPAHLLTFPSSAPQSIHLPFSHGYLWDHLLCHLSCSIWAFLSFCSRLPFSDPSPASLPAKFDNCHFMSLHFSHVCFSLFFTLSLNFVWMFPSLSSSGEESGRCFTIGYVMPMNVQLTSESTVNMLSE